MVHRIVLPRVGEQEKNARNLNWIMSHAGYIVVRRTFLYVSVSIPSAISVSPSLYLHPLLLSPSPSTVHLGNHLYLPLYRS
jgi:hypothetical protein